LEAVKDGKEDAAAFVARRRGKKTAGMHEGAATRHGKSTD